MHFRFSDQNRPLNAINNMFLDAWVRDYLWPLMSTPRLLTGSAFFSFISDSNMVRN